MILLVISEGLIISICGLYLCVLLRDHTKRGQLYSKASILLQSDVQKHMSEFGFQESGASLGSKVLFAIPYSNMGYPED